MTDGYHRRKGRFEALAFRIWAYCEPKGWDCTVSEVASGIDEPMTKVRALVRVKGWSHRFRRTKCEHSSYFCPDRLGADFTTPMGERLL